MASLDDRVVGHCILHLTLVGGLAVAVLLARVWLAELEVFLGGHQVVFGLGDWIFAVAAAAAVASPDPCKHRSGSALIVFCGAPCLFCAALFLLLVEGQSVGCFLGIERRLLAFASAVDQATRAAHAADLVEHVFLLFAVALDVAVGALKVTDFFLVVLTVEDLAHVFVGHVGLTQVGFELGKAALLTNARRSSLGSVVDFGILLGGRFFACLGSLFACDLAGLALLLFSLANVVVAVHGSGIGDAFANRLPDQSRHITAPRQPLRLG